MGQEGNALQETRSQTTAWQKQAETMGKEVAHLQGWFKGMRDNFARLDKLPKSGSGQRVFTERELSTIQKMNFLQKITYHKPEPVSSVSICLQLHRRRWVPSIAGSDAISCRQ